MSTEEEPRCPYVSPTPWGWAQCAQPVHDEATPHAYSPSEAMLSLSTPDDWREDFLNDLADEAERERLAEYDRAVAESWDD